MKTEFADDAKYLASSIEVVECIDLIECVKVITCLTLSLHFRSLLFQHKYSHSARYALT